MTNQEALLAEYTMLRQEILQAVQMNLQAAAVTLPVAAGVIAYGFQVPNSVAFLAAIVVLLSALWFGTYILTKIRTMEAYIYSIIEPKIDGLQRETLLVAKRKKKKREAFRIGTQAVTVIYGFVSLLCLTLAWIFLQHHDALSVGIYSGVTVIFIVLLILGSIKAIRTVSEAYFEDREKEWKAIEEELKPALSSKKERRKA